MKEHDVIIIGGGLAGLSAAIYLSRALRDVLVVDAGTSLAHWEPDIQNYLGFPKGISGDELLSRARDQARRFGAVLIQDSILRIQKRENRYHLAGAKEGYAASRLLLATGIYHLPPKLEAVDECLGHSMFFCKDCDGYRVQGKRVAIVGHNNDAVEYALGIVLYSPSVSILTNGEQPHWDAQHQDWIREYEIPVFPAKVSQVRHEKGQISSLGFEDGVELALDYLFTTRGDLFHNELAAQLGADLDAEGQIVVDICQRTTVPRVYAAGCVTPANCQMIIAAGEGARAAQAINRDMFEESLKNHALRRYRAKQIREEDTEPEILSHGIA